MSRRTATTEEANIASNAKALVKFIMNKYPRARKDDQYLVLALWREQGLRLSNEQACWILKSGMKVETILRRKREIGDTYFPSYDYGQIELFKKEGDCEIKKTTAGTDACGNATD